MGEGFPLWSLVSMVWEGREPLRDWICLSVSLCFCVLRSGLSPFLLYPDISFIVAKEGLQPPYRVSTRVQGAPPASWPPRAPSHMDFSSQKSYIFQKKSPSVFILFGLLLIWIFCKTKKHATNRNWHWALNQYVSPKNSIKSCQKYMKVE